MRFVADVSDFQLLGFLARSRRRMALATGASTLAAVAWGGAVSAWIHESSGNATLNLVLMLVQFLFVLLAGYVAAMLIASLAFGKPWSDRVFLGERPDLDSEDALLESARHSDHTVPFYAILLACGFAVYGVVWWTTDDYVGRYNDHGFFATGMRSPDAEQRIRGVRGLVDPFSAGAADAPVARALLLEKLADEDAEVRMWAAWATGQLLIPEARRGLIRLLDDPEPDTAREAAHALGRLADVLGERQMAERLATESDPRRQRGLLVGLGHAHYRTASEGVAAALPTLAEENRFHAVWALTRGRTTTVRDAVEALDWGDALESRCLLAEAYKQTTTTDDYDRLRALYRDAPVDALCERVSQSDLGFHDDVVTPNLVLMPRETLRQKYVIAAFNVGGPGLEDWLEDILYDEAEKLEVRLLAENLIKILESSPARLPRQ